MNITLYRAVKSGKINQLFGQNLNNFYAQLGLKGHNGIDYRADTGENVYFNYSKGSVCSTCKSPTQGNGVTVLINDGAGNYYKILYWHLLDFMVKEGDTVTLGQLLGRADNTGMYTTGSHLHFGMYYSNKFGNTLMTTNGYGGALDPLPYTKDVFALDAKDIINQEIGIVQSLINIFKKLIGK
jgi:murein DD-endopeptidase MepM/ murein hydrolase activator NlpD